jgi:hypothetical protein
MEFTKTTVIVWGNEAHPRNEALTAARIAKLLEMEADGKTEAATRVLVDEVTTKRFWKDQSAAEEFVAFITAQATLNGLIITSATIEDYVAPV